MLTKNSTIWWALLVLLCALCPVQGAGYARIANVTAFRTVAAPAAWHPTNNAGYTPIAFYEVGSSHYTTNGSAVSLVNQMDGATTLTNNGATSTWPVRNAAAQNGKDSLTFSGDYLVADAFRADQPTEYFVALYPRYNALAFLFSSTNNLASQELSFQSGSTMAINSGSTMPSSATIGPSNLWCVVHCVFTNGGSFIRTNNIQHSAGNSGVESQHGFTVGASTGKSFNMGMDFACLIVYTNLLSTANRSNVYWWLTNQYAIPNP
jgi:hypothetical protein